MEEEKPENASPDFENKEQSKEENDGIESDLSESSTAADSGDKNSPEKRGIVRARKTLDKDATLKGSFIADVTLTSDSDSSLINANVATDGINNNDDRAPSSSSTSSSGDSDVEQEFVKVDERTTSFVTRTGEKTVELSTVCTQTEDSWLKDLELFDELLKHKPELIDKIRSKRKPSVVSTKGGKHHKRKSIAKPSTPGSQLPRQSSSTSDLDEQQPKTNISEEPSREASSHLSRQSIISPLPQTPKDDILYQSPTVELLSSSDSEDEEDYPTDETTHIPSIGPPAILQYFKESQHPPLADGEPDEDTQGKQFLRKSLFTGRCMFCHNEVLPFPTEEELEDSEIQAEELFCCAGYERFVRFELSQRGDTSHVKDEMIDIKPHPPYGTKAARKAAKERAAERARQREMERQKVAGANATNFYALTRQMKTITYSLASTKCMDEGWTVKPLTPVATDSNSLVDPFVIEINPIQQQKRAFLERFYENGQRFLIILPDGSGCCYYPSGNIAVIITTIEKGKFTYIAYEDDDDYDSHHSGMLAVFEPSGHGTCYFRNGTVRMVLDPFGGVLLDNKGARRKKWLWHNIKTHVHAPPFQPITFRVTKQLSLRCLTQDKIILTFNHGKYTAKFNVGAKLKAVRSARPPLNRDDFELHLAEVKQFINIVLDRTQNALRLPKYSRLDKIPLPHRLQKTKDSRQGKLTSLSQQSRHDPNTVTVN